MMETLVKAAGICLAAAMTASLLKKGAPELGLLAALAGTLAVGALALGAARDAAALCGELAELSGLSPTLLSPLLKVTAIGLVTRVGSALCADAGQGALAAAMDAVGAFCALGCAAPLLRAVIALLRGWL